MPRNQAEMPVVLHVAVDQKEIQTEEAKNKQIRNAVPNQLNVLLRSLRIVHTYHWRFSNEALVNQYTLDFSLALRTDYIGAAPRPE